jgi:hypothetical protein
MALRADRLEIALFLCCTDCLVAQLQEMGTLKWMIYNGKSKKKWLILGISQSRKPPTIQLKLSHQFQFDAKTCKQHETEILESSLAQFVLQIGFGIFGNTIHAIRPHIRMRR